MASLNDEARTLLEHLEPRSPLAVREEALYEISRLSEDGLWPSKLRLELVTAITVYLLETLDGTRPAAVAPTENGVYLAMTIFAMVGEEEDLSKLLPFFEPKVKAWKKIAALSVVDRMFSAEPPKQLNQILHARLSDIADAVVHKDVIELNAQTAALAASVVRAMLACGHPLAVEYTHKIVLLKASIARLISATSLPYMIKMWRERAPKSALTNKLEEALALIPPRYVK